MGFQRMQQLGQKEVSVYGVYNPSTKRVLDLEIINKSGLLSASN